MLIRCPNCSRALGETTDDGFLLQPHARSGRRGGSTRRVEIVEPRRLSITCEKCGTTTVWQGGTATASAA